LEEPNYLCFGNDDFIAGGNTGGKSGLQRAPHQVKSLGDFLKEKFTESATEIYRLRV